MFHDVDESLRALLTADVPINPAEIDISFDRPTREWSSRLARPTLNLFLADIRERAELRDQNMSVRALANGMSEVQRRPRRIDLTYIVTAWTTESDDEHRVLAAVMACMFRHGQLPEGYHHGNLETSEYPVLLRMMPPDHLHKPVDLWSVLDNEMRVSLTWVATAPLAAFAPATVPLVRTLTTGFTESGEEWRERFYSVAGRVSRRGDPGQPLPGARVTIDGTGFSAVTGQDGTFRFTGVPPADYRWRIEVEGARSRSLKRAVPSESYSFEA